MLSTFIKLPFVFRTFFLFLSGRLRQVLLHRGLLSFFEYARSGGSSEYSLLAGAKSTYIPCADPHDDLRHTMNNSFKNILPPR